MTRNNTAYFFPNDLPQVVLPKADIDRLTDPNRVPPAGEPPRTWVRLYRGIGQAVGENIVSRFDCVRYGFEFQYSPNFHVGAGVYGQGAYTVTDFEIAKRYAEPSGVGIVLTMLIDIENTPIVAVEGLTQLVTATATVQPREGEAANWAATDADKNGRAKADLEYIARGDNAFLAQRFGIHAITVPQFGYYIILNRAGLIVQREFDYV